MPTTSPARTHGARTHGARSHGAAARVLALGLGLLLLAPLTVLHAADPPAPADSPAITEAVPFYDLEEQHAVSTINAERGARGLAPLAFSPTLTEAAEWMANDLRTRGLSHTDSLGRSLRARLNHFAYPANSSISENIARGFRTGAGVVAAWMDSSGHRSNILNANSVAYGLARAKRPGGPSEWAWVVAFGSIDDGDAGTAPDTQPLAVPLARGWNLLSWSGDWASEEVLRGTLPPSVTSVTTWDAAAAAWFGILPYQNISEIAFVGPGQPLWVWSESAATWDQPLQPSLAREIALIAGWQLVSWQGADGTPIAQALAAILPRVRSAARFQASTQAYDLFRPDFPLSVFDDLDRGDAFWLLVDAPTTWDSGG